MCSEIYKNKKMMPVLALLCALLWALAYPFIKLGYRELGIEANDLGSKILFAGIRFLFSGLLVLLISAISFSVYNSLLANHPISKVAIFNAFIPVFGVVFSCIILGEAFQWKYLIAGIMATTGTYLANHTGKI